MSKKPSARRHYAERTQELNLIPMMNLVSILIPALLVSVSFVTVHIVNARLAASAEDPTPRPETPSCTVSVHRTVDLVRVRAVCEEDEIGQEIAASDAAAITEALRSIQTLSPHSEQLTISADAEVTMNQMIATIDLAQGQRDPNTGRAELFDAVVVSPHQP